MELWKSLRELSETVDAVLPLPAGGIVQHRHAGGTFRAYLRHHHDGKPFLGSAAIELEADEIKPPPERWTAALERAARVDDPWYPLELPASPPLPARTSTLDKQELERWVEPFDEVISRSLAGEPVLPLREHLFFSRKSVQYRDSFGREREELRYEASLEVLLVPRSDPEAHPFTAELRFSEFAPEVITGFLRNQAKQTCDAYQARAWQPQGDYQVLLRGQALAAVFDFLLAQLGAPALAAGDSTLRVRQPLWDGKSQDPVTLTALAELYNSPNSGGFDDEGLVLHPHTLVQDGVVSGFWSTQATAHWLGLPLTGRPRNYSVSPGTQSWSDLSQQRIVEVHRLRWGQVEPSGDFSVEIGLADLHENGTRTPVFGFAFQGNLREVLTNARFSSDVGIWEHYEGPEFLVVPAQFLRSV